MIRVLLDACLLVKGNVGNTLLDFGKHGLIAPHWTPEIAAQFVKNWAKRRVQEENSDRKRSAQAPMTAVERCALEAENVNKAQDRLARLELLAPEWRIPGWDLKAAMAAHPKTSICAAGHGGTVVHGGDYEVALAAIQLTKAFPNDDVWLATENIHHLPPSELKKYGVWSLHQSQLIEELYKEKPKDVEASLKHTLNQTGQGGRKKLEKSDMVRIVGDIQQFNSHTVASALAICWGLIPPLSAAAVVGATPANGNAAQAAPSNPPAAPTQPAAGKPATPKAPKKTRSTKGQEQDPAP